MRTFLGLMLVVGLAMLAGCAEQPAEQASQQPAEQDVLPAAVAAAFEQANPTLEIVEFEREELDGNVVYEIETRTGEFEKDFVYLEDGTLLQIEEEIAVESLPEPVLAAVMAAHPGAEVDEAEMITTGDVVGYQVDVEVAEDQKFELLVSPDGQILSSEQIADNDDDDDDDDGDDDDGDDDDDGEKTGDA